MNRNKNLLILYSLWKKLSKFSNAKKKFSMLFFQLLSTGNFKFSFNVSLFEINCIKIQTINLVSKSIYISRGSLCLIYFDVIIRQRLKEKLKLVELFFSRANEIKTCGLLQQLILGMLRDLFLQSRDIQSLNRDQPLLV